MVPSDRHGVRISYRLVLCKKILESFLGDVARCTAIAALATAAWWSNDAHCVTTGGKVTVVCLQKMLTLHVFL